MYMGRIYGSPYIGGADFTYMNIMTHGKGVGIFTTHGAVGTWSGGVSTSRSPNQEGFESRKHWLSKEVCITQVKITG